MTKFVLNIGGSYAAYVIGAPEAAKIMEILSNATAIDTTWAGDEHIYYIPNKAPKLSLEILEKKLHTQSEMEALRNEARS